MTFRFVRQTISAHQADDRAPERLRKGVTQPVVTDEDASSREHDISLHPTL